MDLAFKYIIKNDGIDKEEFYRYRAHVSQYPAATFNCISKLTFFPCASTE